VNGLDTSRQIEKNRLYTHEEVLKIAHINRNTLNLYFKCGLRFQKKDLNSNSERCVWGDDLMKFLKDWSNAMFILERFEEEKRLQELKKAEKEAAKKTKTKKGE